MNTFKSLLLPVFVVIGFQVYGQGKKERIFICRSNLFEDEHTSDANFNNLVDSACIEINLRHYNDGLLLLNKAIALDSINTGLANEYFRAQRNKLMNFIAEETEPGQPAEKQENDAAPVPGTKSTGPGDAENTSVAKVEEIKIQEKPAAKDSNATDNGNTVKEETPIEKSESKPASELEPNKELVADQGSTSATPVETVKSPINDPVSPRPSPVTPAENVPTFQTILTDENNAPSEVKSFTEEEREEFQNKGMQKVKSLEGFIKQLADRNTPQIVVDEVIESAVSLFDVEDRTVEVSSLRNPNHVKLKVRKYFQKLSMIPYDNINIEWADLQYTSDFRKGVDGNYYGYIIFRQRFTAEKDQVIVYEDLTTKKSEVILKPYNKNIEGQAIQNWDVFLGDISVEQTEKY